MKRRNFYRKERRDVAAIQTALMHIVLAEGQYFCETRGAWEIWQEKPLLLRVKRIRRSQVLWIFPH